MEDDVVFTYYHKHIFPLESIDSTIFKPSKALQNEANNFIQNYLNLGNYVAVHWRMESTHASNIPWLVPEVLRAINEVMEISGTNTVRSYATLNCIFINLMSLNFLLVIFGH